MMTDIDEREQSYRINPIALMNGLHPWALGLAGGLGPSGQSPKSSWFLWPGQNTVYMQNSTRSHPPDLVGLAKYDFAGRACLNPCYIDNGSDKQVCWCRYPVDCSLHGVSDTTWMISRGALAGRTSPGPLLEELDAKLS